MPGYKHFVVKGDRSKEWLILRPQFGQSPELVCAHSRWETAMECAFERAKYAALPANYWRFPA
jgi:hypothetical protein